MKKRKKGVILIVEGVTEQIALGTILQRLAETLNLRVTVVNGDITSDDDSEPSNVRKKLGDLVKLEMQRSSFRKDDVAGVALLMDTDGAFVPNEAIMEIDLGKQVHRRRGSEASSNFRYTEECIFTTNRQKAEVRNERKSRNMMLLRGMKDVRGIPFAAFYMSRNMEHVIAAKAENLTSREKSLIASDFNDSYVGNLSAFKTLINSPDIVKYKQIDGDFRQRYVLSWEYIEQKGSLRSLARASNINLLVELLEHFGNAQNSNNS